MHASDFDLPLADSGELIVRLHNYSVWQTEAYRWLQEGTSVQSMMDRKQPSRLVLPIHHAMFLAIAAAESPTKLLNLGCGLSAVERKLAQDFPFMSCVSVDSSQEIINLARQFFLPPPEHEFVVAKAEQYLHSNNQKYDVIFVDLFAQELVAKCLYSVEFYQGLTRSLDVEGVVAINLIAHDQADLLKILAPLRQYFANVWLTEISGRSNIVLLCAQSSNFDLANIAKQAEKSVKVFGFDLKKIALEFLPLPQPE